MQTIKRAFSTPTHERNPRSNMAKKAAIIGGKRDMASTSTLPTAIVLPFAVTYQGKDTDQHIISAPALGESIIGASKLYNAVAHYSALGFIPRGNYKKEFTCYAKAPREGSFEYFLYVATIAQEANLHGHIYGAAVSWIFNQVIDALKNIWTRKGDTVAIVEALAEVMKEQARSDSAIKEQLINAVTKTNDNMASLHARLIDTLPELAGATRNHGKLFVTPVGRSCGQITQFSGTPFTVSIDEPEAEVIRGGPQLEVADMQQFICKRITEVNIQTGHCILEVEGYDRPISGKINDPALSMPNNVYTRALNNKTPFQVWAKPVMQEGTIHKLFVSDARD